MGFDKAANGTSVTYKLKANFDAALGDSIAADIRQDLEKSEKYQAIVFDVEMYDMDVKSLKALVSLGLELRKSNCQMYVLTTQKDLHERIRVAGLDKTLRPIMGVGEIPAPKAASSKSASGAAGSAKKAPSKLDVSFVNPFIDGTMQVLSVQCQLTAKPLKPLRKGDPSFQCKIDIAGLIGITSQSFQGNIAICFPANVFLKIMGNMLGETFTEITDDLVDGAAELTNMIFGHAKKILNENGHTIEKALPSVARGPDLKIDHGSTHDSIILPFTLEDSCFFMEIGIENNPAT